MSMLIQDFILFSKQTEPTLFFTATTWGAWILLVLAGIVLIREFYYKITKKRSVKGKYVTIALIVMFMTYVIIDTNQMYIDILYTNHNL